MEGVSTEESRYNVVLRLPVKITYKVLEVYLQKKLLGKVLSKGKADGETSDHARIQKISLERSDLEDFDLAVPLQLKLLTRFFRNKEINLTVHLSLGFNQARQEIMIQRYRLDGLNNGWFTNKLIETFVNNFIYSKIKDKMKFDLRPLVVEKMGKLNTRLSHGLEVADGINITGKVNEFQITEVIPGQRTLLVSVSVLGNNVLNIKQIDL